MKNDLGSPLILKSLDYETLKIFTTNDLRPIRSYPNPVKAHLPRAVNGLGSVGQRWLQIRGNLGELSPNNKKSRGLSAPGLLDFKEHTRERTRTSTGLPPLEPESTI